MWYFIVCMLATAILFTTIRWRRLEGEVGGVVVSETSRIFFVSQADKGGEGPVPFAVFELAPDDFPDVRITTGAFVEIGYLAIVGSLMVRRWAVLEVRQGAPPKRKPTPSSL